jgi:hypothetical protein
MQIAKGTKGIGNRLIKIFKALFVIRFYVTKQYL